MEKLNDAGCINQATFQKTIVIFVCINFFLLKLNTNLYRGSPIQIILSMLASRRRDFLLQFSSALKLKVVTGVNRCLQKRRTCFQKNRKDAEQTHLVVKTSYFINKVITENYSIEKESLSMVWTGYLKAFDSIPHSWLLDILDMHKRAPIIKEYITHVTNKG